MKKLIGKVIIAVIILAAVVGIIMMNKQSGTNEDNTLVVGLDDSFPPMGFRNENNEIVGFDIDVAKEVLCEVYDIERLIGKIDNDFNPDLICVTSIFTYWSKYVKNAVSYCRNKYGNDILCHCNNYIGHIRWVFTLHFHMDCKKRQKAGNS